MLHFTYYKNKYVWKFLYVNNILIILLTSNHVHYVYSDENINLSICLKMFITLFNSCLKEGKSSFQVLISTELHGDFINYVLSKSYFGQISKNARVARTERNRNKRGKEWLSFKKTLWITFHLLITCTDARERERESKKRRATKIIKFNLTKIKNSR